MTAQPGTPDSDFPSDPLWMGFAEQAPRWSWVIKPLIHSPAQQTSPPRNDLVLNTSPGVREFRDKEMKPFASK